MTPAAGRSKAHRALVFEYLLGVSLLVTGVIGMAVMQTRMLLLQQGIIGTEDGPAQSEQAEYEADDARSLSASLRVCGDGLERPVDLPCWREQLAALLPPRPPESESWRQTHRLIVDGVEHRVVVRPRTRDDGKGALVVADANSGRLLWQVDGGAAPGYAADKRTLGHPQMRDGMTRQASVVDGDRDGIIDRIYAGDAAGRLWRVDLAGIPPGMPATAASVRYDQPALWSATPMFTAGSLDGAFAPARLQERRFAEGPDVVQAGDADGRYDALLVGSEDNDRRGGANWFYMFKDRAVVSGLPPEQMHEHAQLRNLANECRGSDCRVPGSLRHGWRIPLAARGERVVGGPVTAAGNVFFTTRGAAADDCDAPRSLYILALKDARFLLNVTGSGTVDPAARDIMDIVEAAAGASSCEQAEAGTGQRISRPRGEDRGAPASATG